jgi:hypothetical protein
MSAAAAAPAAPPTSPDISPRRRSHRGIVASLCVLASILGFVSCFAVWANRQALSADNWTNVSAEVLENHQVEDALSAYLVNQLFTSVNVAGELKSALPKQAQGLAGPAAAGLRALADRAVPRLLESSQIHEAWRKANRAAMEQLLSILKGGGKVVSTNNGEVTLNLHTLVIALASQLGLQSQVEAVQEKAKTTGGAAARAAAEQKLGVTLPPESGRIVIMRAKQLKTAQSIAEGIKGLAVVLPVLTVLLFALAVWLADGWRRIALRRVGWCFFGVGFALLLAHRVAGDQIVNSLVVNPSNRPAALAVWSIGTSLLRNIAIAVVVYGLLLIVAAWLSGRTRLAVFVREALAPALRDHSTGAYLTTAGVLLLVVLWGPTPATRQILPVLGFALLLALGVTALRRQAAVEFPQAQSGDALASLRHGIVATRARWSAAGHDSSGAPAAPEAPTAPHAPAVAQATPAAKAPPQPASGDPGGEGPAQP